ncbi:hypothetical protein [Microbacterium luticocti]|uniref:hypothetical protein n=1 Tax=Microbacterium luticocti TaxID=451764 RepID=UPI00041AD4B7|nr:hypothetical protein [Microbacterium luticocti]
MKHLFAAGTALAVVAVLCGCSAIPDDATTPSRLPDTDSVQTPDAATAPSPTPSNSSLFGDTVTNDRGNLVKKIGQIAGTGSVDDPDVITSTFAVTDIVVDRKCTDEFAEKPQNGHYVAVHLNVETTKDLAKEDYPVVGFDAGYWQAYDAKGTRVNDPLGNAFTCLASSEQLPGEIGPAQSVSGWIVLDVPTTHGAVVLAPYGATGWEWDY